MTKIQYDLWQDYLAKDKAAFKMPQKPNKASEWRLWNEEFNSRIAARDAARAACVAAECPGFSSEDPYP